MYFFKVSQWVFYKHHYFRKAMLAIQVANKIYAHEIILQQYETV